MKSFDDWFKSFEIVDTSNKHHWSNGLDQDIVYELTTYNDYDTPEHELVYPCVRCEALFEICCDADVFDPDTHYCGRSERCIP